MTNQLADKQPLLQKLYRALGLLGTVFTAAYLFSDLVVRVAKFGFGPLLTSMPDYYLPMVLLLAVFVLMILKLDTAAAVLIGVTLVYTAVDNMLIAGAYGQSFQILLQLILPILFALAAVYLAVFRGAVPALNTVAAVLAAVYGLFVFITSGLLNWLGGGYDILYILYATAAYLLLPLALAVLLLYGASRGSRFSRQEIEVHRAAKSGHRVETQLGQLENLRSQGVLSEEEYRQKREAVLAGSGGAAGSEEAVEPAPAEEDESWLDDLVTADGADEDPEDGEDIGDDGENRPEEK